MAQRLFNKTNRFIVKHRMLIFLNILLLLMVLFPLLESHATKYVPVLEFSISILLIAGMYIVSSTPRLLTVAFLLGALIITIIWFNRILHYHNLMLLSVFLEVVFLGLTTFVIVTHVLQHRRVSADKIYGAICGYFLLGLIWALIYTLIENLQPGAFRETVDTINTHHTYLSSDFHFSQFMYYSFVTLTTLGYGDIVPTTDIARIIASFEAMIGQLYVAVLISRLVGLHIVHTYHLKQ